MSDSAQTPFSEEDEKFMRLALQEAERAAELESGVMVLRCVLNR